MSTRREGPVLARDASAQAESPSTQPSPKVGPLSVRGLALAIGALDVVAAAAVFLLGSIPDPSRLLFRLAVLSGAWAALGIACARGQPIALAIRRLAGVVGIAWTALLLDTTRRVASTPALLAVAVELALGSLASHVVLVRRRQGEVARRAERTARHAAPVGSRRRFADGDAPSDRSRWTWLAWSVGIGGALLAVEGFVESRRGNFYLGFLVIAAGVLAMRRAADVGPTHTDARLGRRSPSRHGVWILVPLFALAMLARVAWLLRSV